MNSKLLTLCALASTILMAATPMVPTSMSTDNSGTKLAIDAYSDGGGVLLINQAADTKFDNSSMNKLVFKYGDAAKKNVVTLVSEVKTISTVATQEEKIMADSVQIAASVIVATQIVTPPPVTVFKSSATNLVNKINTTLIGGVGSSGSAPSGLFDGTTPNEWNTGRVMYWYGTTTYVEIKTIEPFRIWRSGTTSWISYTGPLKIEVKNLDGTYTDVTSYNEPAVAVNNLNWTLMTKEMPAGQYRFTYASGLHLDSEWFVEGKVVQ